MYTYIITYRFETKNGENRPIREELRNWITKKKDDGSYGKCDETTSTAIYRSNEVLDFITTELDTLYILSKDSKRKQDFITIFVFDKTNRLTVIRQLINKGWKTSTCWKEMFGNKDV